MNIKLSSKIYFASLGCHKNLVDSQVMLGFLDREGFKAVSSPMEAEVIVVNTCSFIEAAKVESVDTILELADYKKNGSCRALVVAGCLSQRYPEELEKELPEVDLFIGTGEYNKITQLLNSLKEGELKNKTVVSESKYIHSELDPRINTSPFYTAWLKVSEGCDRHCSFCIIPSIRGVMRSRSIDSLVIEAKKLAESGVTELNLIAQDLSVYGSDLSGADIIGLLDRLEEIEGIRWIRLLYYYPDGLDEKLIFKIKNSSKICAYLDMPIQHFSDSVLKRMNRNITGEEILDKIKWLKAEIPEMVIRTSIIVGFPGEEESDFQQLLEGIETSKFNHLGIFRYSDEEDAPSYKLHPKVPSATIEKRYNSLYDLQRKISKSLNQKLVSKKYDVLIEGYHSETELLYQGRYFGQAPEIDGVVIINDTSAIKDVEIGKRYSVEITEALDHDLVGRIISL